MTSSADFSGSSESSSSSEPNELVGAIDKLLSDLAAFAEKRGIKFKEIDPDDSGSEPPRISSRAAKREVIAQGIERKALSYTNALTSDCSAYARKNEDSRSVLSPTDEVFIDAIGALTALYAQRMMMMQNAMIQADDFIQERVQAGENEREMRLVTQSMTGEFLLEATTLDNAIQLLKRLNFRG